MSTLAWKNLFHDKVRLAVTLTGIVFALVLIVVQFGLFLGFLDTSANVVAHSGVDLWLSAPGIPHVNGASPIPESRRYQALEVPGVQEVEKLNIQFVAWKLPSGSQESVQIVGFDLNSRMGGPWNIVAGSIDDLRGEDTVMIDRLYFPKLGVTGLGQTVEMDGRRARVVALTEGIRSFTTAPYIYTSFKNSLNYTALASDQTFFLLVKIAPGADLVTVKKRLQTAIPQVDVYTNQEMLTKTQSYWVFSTGAGVTTLMGAVLGLLVGVVVVAQTIYAATVDHIKEFGTLKAMGARNSHIYRVIIEQALISAVLGYGIAIGIGFALVRAFQDGDAFILLPASMVAALFGLAILMCVAASTISIRKATTIDPAMVFRN